MAKKKKKQGEGSVFPRKDGRWEGRIVVDYKDNGNPITKNVTAKTEAECREKFEKLKKEVAHLIGRLPKKPKPDMPFGDWIDLWYQTYCKPTIRATTQSEYEDRIYLHIIPNIGDIPLDRLSQNDLQTFYGKIKKSGRLQYVEKFGAGLSDRMVRAVHASCRSALERAVQDGLITRNPAIGCKLPPKKAREMEVLCKEELRRFLLQAKEDGFYEMFMLDFATGMRRGELLGLQWSDLNFRTGELHIQRQVYCVNGKLTVNKPKTKTSDRTIILPKSVVGVLAEYRKTVDSRWMFPSPIDPDVPRYPTSVGDILSILLKRAGCKHVRFHDLRHTFATMALENGMDVKTLSATIGHVSAATTLDIYSHMTDTMQMQAAVSIDRKIGGTNAQMPSVEQTPEKTVKPPVNAPCAPTEPHSEPVPRKIRKSGTGCLYQINDSLWEGSFFPRLPNGKRKKFNVYAETKEQCEIKLAEMIERVKAEIAEEKAKLKEGAE